MSLYARLHVNDTCVFLTQGKSRRGGYHRQGNFKAHEQPKHACQESGSHHESLECRAKSQQAPAHNTTPQPDRNPRNVYPHPPTTPPHHHTIPPCARPRWPKLAARPLPAQRVSCPGPPAPRPQPNPPNAAVPHCIPFTNRKPRAAQQHAVPPSADTLMTEHA